MLVDRVWQGQQRKLLLHADRNGHFYVLDRTNGKFLQATPFVYQNWNTGFDANGRNLPVPGSNSSPEGSFFVYPHSVGGTNYQSPSYSPRTGLFYLQYSERGGQFASAPGVPEMGRRYIGGGKALTPAVRQPNEPEPSIGVKALDVATGKTVWDFRFDTWPTLNGVLATAGNVLFVSGRDGRLIALDAASGKHLRHHSIGRPGSGQISPMSYAIDGRQYVAMSYAGTLHAFALPTPVR
jgi:alcohol dehydrogenase (cytochrome c)